MWGGLAFKSWQARDARLGGPDQQSIDRRKAGRTGHCMPGPAVRAEARWEMHGEHLFGNRWPSGSGGPAVRDVPGPSGSSDQLAFHRDGVPARVLGRSCPRVTGRAGRAGWVSCRHMRRLSQNFATVMGAGIRAHSQVGVGCWCYSCRKLQLPRESTAKQ